jgi:hypothetical protein
MKRIWDNKWPLAGTLLAVLLMALLSSRAYSWAGWRPATCLPGGCFCEAVAAGILRQPANTWSSLGFVVAGLTILQQALRDARSPQRPGANRMRSQPLYPLAYGVAVVAIGAGSAFFHASLSFTGQVFDLFGMYLLATFIVAYNIARWHAVPQRVLIAGYLLVNLALAVGLWHIPALRRYLFALALAGALLLEIVGLRRRGVQGDLRLLWAALALNTVAFLIWIADITRLLCASGSWLQGHAIWHLLGALSSLALYHYYRSERPPAALTQHGPRNHS